MTQQLSPPSQLLAKSLVLRVGEALPSKTAQEQLFSQLHWHDVHLDEGDYVVHVGDVGDRYFYVESGTVLVEDGLTHEVLFEFKAGQGFGEHWLVRDHAPALVSCRAGAGASSSATVLKTLTREEFQLRLGQSLFAVRGPYRGRIVRAKSSKETMALGRDVVEFRGVRFANRASRFALPQVVVDEQLQHDAFEYGPECAQIKDGMSDMLGGAAKPRDRPAVLHFVRNTKKATAQAGAVAAALAPGGEEDCLQLNVYAPASTTSGSSSSLAVMVWIHGGAFVTGAGSLPTYNGRELASKGVVVVTINYRLGALGFLCGVPGVDINLGLHDQIAALRWVQRHIHHFGGDRSRVTVFGESAGGMSATCLLGMRVRREERLFTRCIVQSGGGHAVHDESQATLISGLFLDALGKRLGKKKEQPPTLHDLNTCDMQAIVDAMSEVSKKATLRELYGYGMTFQPSVLHNGPVSKDALFGCVSPLVAVARGVADDVTLLLGVNNNEYSLFMMDSAWRRRYNKLKASRRAFSAFLVDRLVSFASEEDVRHRPVANVKQRAQRVVDFYLPPVKDGDDGLTEDEARSAFERIHSCWVFEVGSEQLLAVKQRDGGVNKTYSYRVCFESPMAELQAAHAIDLPLVFGTYKSDPALGLMLCGGDTSEAQQCSREMMAHWVAFAQQQQGSGGGGLFADDGLPKLFGNYGGTTTDPALLCKGSLFKTREEQRVWRGFMEKVELNYSLVWQKRPKEEEEEAKKMMSKI